MNAILLATRSCQHPAQALEEPAISNFLACLPGWTRAGNSISKEFIFSDHYHLMAFINAIAWIAHRSNHHPDIRYSYKTCTVSFTTHDAGGLSENDFICAAKVDILLAI